MKTKNILMSILLVIGSIAAKAAGGYPPELALVSQPVMVYNYNSITVIYDVENIGDYTYRGYVSLFLDPDYGYSYAEKYVRVYPGRIKRIEIDIPLYRINRRYAFTIMPYYELDNELYSFTTFEYFEPINFFWNGPRNERWVVITVPPRIRYYHRPGTYRYYYDGYRPPMPPPGHGPGMPPPPPMDPKHHTYGYHHSNGGYPATHPEVYNPPASNNEPAPTATVRPKANAGSMSSGHSNTSSGSTSGSVSGSVSGSNSNNSSGRASSSSSSSDNGTSTRPVTNSSTSRPSSGTSGSSRASSSSSSSRSSGNNNSGSSRASSSSSSSRSTGTSSSGSSRTSSSSSSSRSSGTSSNGSSRTGSSSSSSRSSGTNSSGSSRTSSSSNSSRSSSSGRR